MSGFGGYEYGDGAGGSFGGDGGMNGKIKVICSSALGLFRLGDPLKTWTFDRSDGAVCLNFEHAFSVRQHANHVTRDALPCISIEEEGSISICASITVHGVCDKAGQQSTRGSLRSSRD